MEKTIIELKPTKLIAVKIPDDVVKVELTNHKDGLIFYSNNNWEQIDFPPKEKYKLIGIAKKINEDDLKGFIFSHGQRNGRLGVYSSFPRFEKEQPELGTSNITHSFQCLMRSYGFYKNEKYGVGIIEKDNFAIVTSA